MDSQKTRAAQYIRMSTDRQDLSPLLQKEAIGTFAERNGFEVVCSYEDEGKSGLTLANRPQMRQLLKDVVDGAGFTVVLVYDVSRWGRFQDADAAAYYEYHCRMHGVQILYTGETFTNDLTPTSVLVKSMRRVMAAEYSRDLATKSRAGQQRVVSMGFHMGPLPPFGYRRCSVSADGTRRKLLQRGELKVALTDRIEWVLGPEQEIALVRRICSAYVAGYQLEEIAGLVDAEGWRTDKGRAVTTRTINNLLGHEALIGNFVWGRKSKGGKVISCSPTRRDGSVPRIIDERMWATIQDKRRDAALLQGLPARQKRGARRKTPGSSKPRQLNLAFGPHLGAVSYRRNFGTAQQLRDHTREFGRALCTVLREVDLPARFDPQSNLLALWGTRVRIRLMWPTAVDSWRLQKVRATDIPYVLIARMAALCRPIDFFIVPGAQMASVFSKELSRSVPRSLKAYLCISATDVLQRLSRLASAHA